MIDKALKKQIQIKAFMVDHEQDFEDIKLTIDDWNFFYKIHIFFQLFAGFIFYGENATSSISQVFKAMDALLKHYEQKKKSILIPRRRTKKCSNQLKWVDFYLINIIRKLMKCQFMQQFFFLIFESKQLIYNRTGLKFGINFHLIKLMKSLKMIINIYFHSMLLNLLLIFFFWSDFETSLIVSLITWKLKRWLEAANMTLKTS